MLIWSLIILQRTKLRKGITSLCMTLTIANTVLNFSLSLSFHNINLPEMTNTQTRIVCFRQSKEEGRICAIVSQQNQPHLPNHNWVPFQFIIVHCMHIPVIWIALDGIESCWCSIPSHPIPSHPIPFQPLLLNGSRPLGFNNYSSDN